MFRFENPIYLYGLFLLPVIFAIYLLGRRNRLKRLERMGNTELISGLFENVSKYKHWAKIFLLLSGLSFLILGIANPQIGTRLDEAKREGVEIVVALDVSNSMLSEDLKPNRLERAKQAVMRLIDKLGSDKLGIVAFAGDAFLYMPMTTDYSAAKLLLSSANQDLIESQGTAMGKAIDVGIKAFGTEKRIGRAMIILTDGENHEDDAVSSAKEAASKGIVVHTIGMGSIGGGPIPVFSGANRVGFMKDENGQTIISKLDAQMLQDVANAGGGKFIRSAENDPDLSELTNELSKMNKKEYKSKVYSDFEDRFQVFLGLALLLMFIELILSERKNKLLTSLNLFGDGK